MSEGEPRIAPGGRAEIGRVNHAIARVAGAAVGGGPPNVMTTLAHHRRLFRPWLRFAGRLMPGGLLPRADSELLILRVAANCGSDYEWHHHRRLGLAAGLSVAQTDAVRERDGDELFTARQRSLLRAADELHSDRDLSDATWSELRAMLRDPELVEVCMLVGHYEMLAMTLNALRVQPDALPDAPPRAVRTLQRVVDRRRGTAR